MQAIILAAGMGMRLRALHQEPKGLLVLGQKPIIQESINKLRAFGVTRIVVVTGYLKEAYDDYFKDQNDVECVHNPFYSKTGSLQSLIFGLKVISDSLNSDESVLVLESDIIYEKRAIECILNADASNIIALSGETQSGDEVYVQASDDGSLINMSKNRADLVSSYGEFVGVNKLSKEACELLIDMYPDGLKDKIEGHYEETGLVELAKQVSVFLLKINDLKWAEIDCKAHYDRALKIYEGMRNEG
jgi:choline kinase